MYGICVCCVLSVFHVDLTLVVGLWVFDVFCIAFVDIIYFHFDIVI